MPSHIFTRVGRLAGVRRHQRALEGSGQGGQRARRGLSRVRLHGVRVPAARPRRRGASQHRRCDEDQRRQRALRRALCHRRDAGALCVRARRVAGGGEAAADRQHLSLRRGDHVFRAQRGRGAQRRPRRGAQGCRAARNLPQGAARREEHLLGHRGRDPATGRSRMDRAGRRQVRRGAQVHARRRRPRGPQREAHRHAGPHRSRARAAGRHAARAEATRRRR